MMEEEKSPDPDVVIDPQVTEEEGLQEKPREYTIMRGVQTVISVGILMATLLTLWNPRKLVKQPDLAALLNLQAADSNIDPEDSADTTSHIAILAGHYQHDSGEVCADGLVEAEINHEIASRVAISLQDEGFTVDLFPEFDLDLLHYQGKALIAIYSGSCAENPLPESGFKVGTSLTAQNLETVTILAACLGEEYQNRTRLPFSYEVINPSHFSFHIFTDIHPDTPAVLIEIGSLKTDREVILGSTSAVVEGITAGITCFINYLGRSAQ